MDTRWIFLCAILFGCYISIVPGELQTSLNDFTYTISTGFGDSDTYWNNADKCEKQQGWPVTYATLEEYEHIQNWVLNETQLEGKKLWVGLTSYKREHFEWIDSRLSVDSFVDDLWADPTDVDRGNKCVVQESSGFLSKVHCTGQKAYMVCKIPISGESLPDVKFPEGPCPQGYTKAVEEPDKCYKVVTLNHETGLTFEEAREACRNDGPRADLASLKTDSNHQRAELLSMMYERVTGYWLGLERVGLSSWQWDDNSPIRYMGSMNYNYDCGQLVFIDSAAGKPGDINSADCRVNKGYICQTGAGNDGDPEYTTPAPSHPCDDSLSDYYHEACYKVMETPMTWSLAKEKCHPNDLVAIHSVNENAYVQLYALTVNQPVWIGLYTEGSQYQWSNGWLVDYTNFGNRRTLDTYASQSCVYMKTDGTWYVGSCDLKYPAVCEKPFGDPVTLPQEIEGLCSSKTDLEWYDESGSMCYNATSVSSSFRDQGWTWLEAMELCLQANPKASLASIPTRAINNDLVNHARDQHYSTKGGVWIGLFRDKSGIFRWVDGSPMTYENWVPGFPSNSTTHNCAIVNIDDKNGFLWNETSCDDKQGFVCMMEKDVTPVAPPPSSDSCPDDTWDHFGDDCFLFASNSEERYDRAQAACQHYTGAELASIHNEDENKFIRWYLHQKNAHAAHRAYWIGLIVKAAGDIEKVEDVELQWQDASSVDYTHFYRDEPRPSKYDDQCVTLDTEHGMWITEECSLSRGFVCRVNKGVNLGRGELSGGDLAGIIIGVILLTLVVAVGLFLGVAWLLKRNNKRLTGLPFGFENVLYKMDGK